MILFENIKNTMELSYNFFQAIQNLVLRPDLGNALILFSLSFLNELVAVFPYAIVLSGQLLFLKGSFSLVFITKLFFFVAIPVGVGSALGAIPIYILGYLGGKPLIEKFHKHLHFSWQDVEKVNSRLKGEWYDEIVFLLLRSIPLIPALPINIAAGIMRMRFWSYFVITTVGFIIRMMLVLLVVGLGVQTLSNFLIFIYTT
ncbi:MAG: VTT domain-containing protein [bacterium]|nr:VTT domain-containing protein [bacterium]